MHLPEKSALFRHRIISFLRDQDIRGIRKLSVLMPKWLLKNPQKVEKHIRKTIHGVKLIIDPANDAGVELSLYETGTYEKGTIQLLQSFLEQGDTFIDVGANIGLMSCIASKIVGKEGKVIAVEPNPETAAILRENLKLNECTNVEVMELGLAAISGNAQLFENRHVNRGGASVINQGKDNDPENISHGIQLTTLDIIATDRAIKLIKIDVEGFELEVLKGAYNTLIKKQPALIVEVSDVRTSDESVSPLDVYKYLGKLSVYRFFKQKGTKERRSDLVEILSEKDLPGHDNLVCLPD